MSCLELSSMHEEADILITQHTIYIAKEYIESTQAWGEYWTKVLEYKYKYLKK